MGILLKELKPADCQPGLLADFDRHQEVRRCWQNTDGQWLLRDCFYTVDWDDGYKKTVVDKFSSCLESGGYVIGAYDGNSLIGFATVDAELFGSANQYANMKFLHVSNGHRGQGIGKMLFFAACEKARVLGAAKLYISAHSAEGPMAFYRKAGCVDAAEINRALFEAEPHDCHLEYEL